MSKILVTGGAGFIGSHVVVELVAHGFEPINVDDFSNSDRHVLAGLERFCGYTPRCYGFDCQDRKALEIVLHAAERIGDAVGVQGVIHFAASNAVGESIEEPLRYYRNNVVSLLSLLEVMRAFEIRDLVFSCSCCVYGNATVLPVTEEAPCLPSTSVYARTKRICESLVQDDVAASQGARAVSLRYFNPIGAHPNAAIGEWPGASSSNLIPAMLRSAGGLAGPIRVSGDDWETRDGTCVRDYIHVMDLASAHVEALAWLKRQSNAPCYDVFDARTGRGTSVLDAFRRATGQKLKYEFGPRRFGDIEETYANCDKGKNALGWQAARGLEDALEDAWRWQTTLSNGSFARDGIS